MYVDHVLSGADTIEDARDVIRELDQFLMAGGFPLQKWAASHPAMLSKLEPHRLAIAPDHDLSNQQITRALGPSWNASSDHLEITIVKQEPLTLPTKRGVLSRIARLFNPMGWIAPVIIAAKILIQLTWQTEPHWDDPLPESLADQWRAFERNLNSIDAYRIPRWLGTLTTSLGLEIHAFADASSIAYGAVIYLRVLHTDDTATVSLLRAKSKVAPLKKQTIPRLELSAALLASCLSLSVIPCFTAQNPKLHLWTDSTVTLTWLRGTTAQWKEFVANRVQLIHDLIPNGRWHLVPGKDNPADCASQGLTPTEFLNHDLWWKGPPWLSRHSVQWPSEFPIFKSDVDLERRSAKVTAAISALSDTFWWELLHRYRTLTQLLGFTAWIRRAVSKFKSRSVPCNSFLTPVKFQEAEQFWITTTQRSIFTDEIRQLEQGKLLKSSALARLAPFIDDNGIMKHALLDSDTTHPAILPRESPFTSLVLASAHRRTLHGGPQLILATLCRKFWILGGRNPIRMFIHRCNTCARFRGKTAR